MDKRSRKPIMVQKVQEKTCSQCNKKAVFVEMKKLFCPEHYARFKNIPLDEHRDSA